MARRTGMQFAVEEIVKAAGRLDEFNKALAEGSSFGITIKNEGYMPLSISVLDKNKVSVSHYGFQNGDIMRDPEMVFEIQAIGPFPRPKIGPVWVPTEFRNDYVGYHQDLVAVRNTDGTVAYLKNPRDSFPNIWARNLKEQGFIEAAKEMKADLVAG